MQANAYTELNKKSPFLVSELCHITFISSSTIFIPQWGKILYIVITKKILQSPCTARLTCVLYYYYEYNFFITRSTATSWQAMCLSCTRSNEALLHHDTGHVSCCLGCILGVTAMGCMHITHLTETCTPCDTEAQFFTENLFLMLFLNTDNFKSVASIIPDF